MSLKRPAKRQCLKRPSSQFPKLLSLLLCLPFPALAAGLQGNVHTQWHSRYISEGRDNLDGASFYTASLDLSVTDLSTGVWQGWEEAGPYRENNLYVEYAPLMGDWEPYVNLTYLQFHPDDPDDLEAGVGVSRQLTRIFSVALDGTWSKQAEGSFYGLSLFAEKDLTDTLNTTLRLTQTYDHGYASEAYNGLNNSEAGIRFSWTRLKPVMLHAGWQYSWAGEDVRRSDGADEHWGEIGLMAYF